MEILPYIPEYITVHLGAPGEEADNVTVSYPDYLKNVASSELYPTWPDAALRANIYAQSSFVLNRVYTEYYREQGYDFDITSLPAYDQAFVYEREIFENVSNIVDEIFNSYIRRENSIVPLYASYCNGTTTVCDGLSQWGSVSLANSGYSALDILKYYYGDDIILVENVPVQGLTLSVPEINLRRGSISNDVRTLQIRLNRIATNYPSIPKIYQVNGIFGIETDDAVREFQKIFNLTVDGVVGKQTWYAVQYVYNGVKRLNELVGEGLTYDEVAKKLPDELRPGDSGELVSGLQYFLNFLSQYDNIIPSVKISGYYDEATTASVKAFQRKYGLDVTGVMSPADYNVMYDAYIGIINSLPESQYGNTALPYPGFQLYYGIENEYVRYLQQYINKISDVYKDIPKLVEDGIYGEATREAVSIFQAIYGLYVNGITGAVTWNAISDVYNDISAGNNVNEGQYPGYVLEEESEG